ncbi:MAG: hypothetical protein ACYDAA_11315 [Syntrophales bacterium]
MSQLIHHQDAVTDLLQAFDAMFRLVVPSPGREVVGLKAISEKQRGAPGWYLWFEDRPGAYLMELIEAETVAGAEGGFPDRHSAVRGTYSIKYYPAADDGTSLAALSDSERAVRAGECFDATGTPDYDRGCGIPATSFLIGTIEMILASDGDSLVLHLESLDRWITSVREQTGAGVTERRDRDLPAWDWSWFLLDRLILTLCLAYRTVPRRVSLSEEPGYVFRVETDGETRAMSDNAVHRRRLSASFALREEHGHGAGCSGARRSPRPDPQKNPQEDGPYRPLFSGDRESARPNLWVSPAWWHIHERHADLGGALPC